jgi:hypothetical protein
VRALRVSVLPIEPVTGAKRYMAHVVRFSRGYADRLTMISFDIAIPRASAAALIDRGVPLIRPASNRDTQEGDMPILSARSD